MPDRAATGIPPGLITAVRAILQGAPGPMRRRDLLKTLEARGHRVSLAGLNRALEFARGTGEVGQNEEGVWWIRRVPAP